VLQRLIENTKRRRYDELAYAQRFRKAMPNSTKGRPLRPFTAAATRGTCRRSFGGGAVSETQNDASVRMDHLPQLFYPELANGCEGAR
jgi:hypothetical protein